MLDGHGDQNWFDVPAGARLIMNQVSTAAAVALLLLAPSAALASGTVVRSVRVSAAADGVAVIVEADGPLPVPTVGVVEGPPRIYLDFQDVTTATAGIPVEGNALVRRVRVALNQAQPPVTRVVIQLRSAAPHRIEAGERERGQLTVVIGAPAAPPPPAKTATAQPPAQAAPTAPRRGERAAPPTAPPPAAQPAVTPSRPPAAGAVSRPPGTSATVVRAVRLVPGADGVAISVEADGPLPSPVVGEAKGPPRIYLDFRDVTTATAGIRTEGNAPVRRVRVALNQSEPPVTRIVIELAGAAPHRVETGERERGQVTVVVGTPAAPPPPPPPSAKVAAPQPPARVAPTTPPSERAAPPVPPPPVAQPAAPPPRPPAADALPRTPGAGTSRAVVRSVRLASGTDGVRIIVQADGPLPSPTVGVAKGPPRIYLDFHDVTTATSGMRTEGSPLVRRVRVALNRDQPPVTRVVIELAREAPHRIEALERDQLTLVIGSPAAAPPVPPPPPAAAAPPKSGTSQPAAARQAAAAHDSPASPPPSPKPAASAASSPARPGGTAAPPPANDAERYLQQTSVALDRLEQLRPVLASLQLVMPLSRARLKEVAGDFDSIRQALAAIQPPQTLADAHALLDKVCVEGGRSAATRLEAVERGDTAMALHAAAAAAGALTLLDQARSALGFTKGPPRKRE